MGRDYGYDPLGDSECLLNQYQFTENGIEIGDTVQISIYMPGITNALIDKYNIYAAENGYK